jgi:DNA gyrase/topoisomerase IV subunit B
VDDELHRERLHLREHDQHPRGRHPRRGLPRGADDVINKYAREKGLLKEKDDNLTGDDIREGSPPSSR